MDDEPETFAPKPEVLAVAGTEAQARELKLKNALTRRAPTSDIAMRWMAVAAAATIVMSGGIAWRTMVGGGSGTSQPVADARRDAELQNSPPTVEVEMSGEEVRVYQFANDADADTAVYFIVDPALEL